MFQPDLLHDKRILITGGGTGFGQRDGPPFSRTGRHGLHLRTPPASSIRSGSRTESRGAGTRFGLSLATFVICRACEEMIESIWKDGPLDILVNNAAGNFLARTEELSPGAFEAVLGIVLMGTINATMACGRRWLQASPPGIVLNIAATYASTGSAYVVPSAMAKAGVVALTRSLAVEWGDRGIRMNAIAPGPIPTEGAFSRLLPRPELEKFARERNPLRRFGTVEELANLAAFLVSDGSGYINGDVVVMDGGEQLQGAGEFSALGRLLNEDDWKSLKPRKAGR